MIRITAVYDPEKDPTKSHWILHRISTREYGDIVHKILKPNARYSSCSEQNVFPKTYLGCPKEISQQPTK